ncbi:hypothetical protein HPB47_025025 [Ixodes persulcatus]|uniref:Uncharacterized protein n=1 Tax=Ixodes persulcatus TaxID=34615 RepID=A0AC60Q3V9_IXOPE|nr:hypothetical protein HPB47_025025 [Ixodes persulcatus]
MPGHAQVLQASDRDGLWLDEVPMTDAFRERELGSLCTPGPDAPRPTMDDFYLLLSVMLCNLPRVQGSNLSRHAFAFPARKTWFQNRTNDLVSLFPAVSAPPRVPLYQADQADAIAQFGEQWPHTRAAVCRALLHARFAGPAARLQEYVSVGWRFAGMKHVHLVLEFLTERNSWVLDAVPELRANSNRLQAFLRAYQSLGADGPYMKLLHLPEAVTSLRKHLGLHVAAAYALAVVEDDNWLNYKGVPRDRDEQAIIEKIRALKELARATSDRDTLVPKESADA